MAKNTKSSIEKLLVLRRFLYQSGPWNGHRPFAYDMKDPLGKTLSNKRLAHFMRTRLGNCVTMPMLALVLGRRMGLKMTLAVAPLHVFIKFTDDAGKVWNLEATSGLGSTRDMWLRQELPMTDRAIEEGTYLRPLSEAENASLAATLLVEHEMQARRAQNVIAATNIMLRYNPRDAITHVWRGSAYSLKLRREVVNVYPDLSRLPPDVKIYADAILQQNLADFAAAEALGWTERDGIKK